MPTICIACASALRSRWLGDEGRSALGGGPRADGGAEAQIQETVILGVLTHRCEVRVPSKLTSLDEVRYDADVMRPRPAYCTAMGRTLLAHAPQKHGAGLSREGAVSQAHPAPTLVSASALRSMPGIAQARQAGSEIVLEEFSAGGSGAAVPVVDTDGQVLAALNVATVTSRFESKRDLILDELHAAARRVSPEARRPVRFRTPAPPDEKHAQLEPFRPGSGRHRPTPWPSHGIDVLSHGGSAADAVVAIQAVLSPAEPHASGLGGRFVIVWHNAADGRHGVIDGLACAPQRVTERIEVDHAGRAFLASGISGGWTRRRYRVRAAASCIDDSVAKGRGRAVLRSTHAGEERRLRSAADLVKTLREIGSMRDGTSGAGGVRPGARHVQPAGTRDD
jgi:hypothetical protein